MHTIKLSCHTSIITTSQLYSHLIQIVSLEFISVLQFSLDCDSMNCVLCILTILTPPKTVSLVYWYGNGTMNRNQWNWRYSHPCKAHHFSHVPTRLEQIISHQRMKEGCWSWPCIEHVLIESQSDSVALEFMQTHECVMESEWMSRSIKTKEGIIIVKYRRMSLYTVGTYFISTSIL